MEREKLNRRHRPWRLPLAAMARVLPTIALLLTLLAPLSMKAEEYVSPSATVTLKDMTDNWKTVFHEGFVWESENTWVASDMKLQDGQGNTIYAAIMCNGQQYGPSNNDAPVTLDSPMTLGQGNHFTLPLSLIGQRFDVKVVFTSATTAEVTFSEHVQAPAPGNAEIELYVQKADETEFVKKPMASTIVDYAGLACFSGLNSIEGLNDYEPNAGDPAYFLGMLKKDSQLYMSNVADAENPVDFKVASTPTLQLNECQALKSGNNYITIPEDGLYFVALLNSASEAPVMVLARGQERIYPYAMEIVVAGGSTKVTIGQPSAPIRIVKGETINLMAHLSDLVSKVYYGPQDDHQLKLTRVDHDKLTLFNSNDRRNPENPLGKGAYTCDETGLYSFYFTVDHDRQIVEMKILSAAQASDWAELWTVGSARQVIRKVPANPAINGWEGYVFLEGGDYGSYAFNIVTATGQYGAPGGANFTINTINQAKEALAEGAPVYDKDGRLLLNKIENISAASGNKFIMPEGFNGTVNKSTVSEAWTYVRIYPSKDNATELTMEVYALEKTPSISVLENTEAYLVILDNSGNKTERKMNFAGLFYDDIELAPDQYMYVRIDTKSQNDEQTTKSIYYYVNFGNPVVISGAKGQVEMSIEEYTTFKDTKGYYPIFNFRGSRDGFFCSSLYDHQSNQELSLEQAKSMMIGYNDRKPGKYNIQFDYFGPISTKRIYTTLKERKPLDPELALKVTHEGEVTYKRMPYEHLRLTSSAAVDLYPGDLVEVIDIANADLEETEVSTVNDRGETITTTKQVWSNYTTLAWDIANESGFETYEEFDALMYSEMNPKDVKDPKTDNLAFTTYNYLGNSAEAGHKGNMVFKVPGAEGDGPKQIRVNVSHFDTGETYTETYNTGDNTTLTENEGGIGNTDQPEGDMAPAHFDCIFFVEQVTPETLVIMFKNGENLNVVGTNNPFDYVALTKTSAGRFVSAPGTKHYHWNGTDYDVYDGSQELPEGVKQRIDAEGNLYLYNGDNFVIADIPDTNPQGERHTYTKVYSFNGVNAESTAFALGKEVRVFLNGDKRLNSTTTKNFDASDMAAEFEVENGTFGEGDINYYPITVDVSVPSYRYYRWGDEAGYRGRDFYLWQVDLFQDHPTKEDGKTPDLPKFVYHPDTKLYTLTMDEVSGPLNIFADDWNESTHHGYAAIDGQAAITTVGQPYQMYQMNTLDGLPTTLSKDATSAGFFIQQPEYAYSSTSVDNVTSTLYKNVTFVLDPSTNRLWVYIQPRDLEKAETTEPAPENPNNDSDLYIIFVSPNETLGGVTGFADQYEDGLNDYLKAQNTGYSVEQGEGDHTFIRPMVAKYNGATITKNDVAYDQFAKYVIEYYNNFFSVVGHHKMVPTATPGRYVSGYKDINNNGIFGEEGEDGWIDYCHTNIKTATNKKTDYVSNPESPNVISGVGNKFDLEVWLTHEDNNKQTETYDMIYYFFSERPYEEGMKLGDYLAYTVTYGAPDEDTDFYQNRTIAAIDPETKEVTRDNALGSSSRYSETGKRYFHPFDWDNEVVNVEQTKAIDNDTHANAGKYTGELAENKANRAALVEQIQNFALYGMKVMFNSKFYVIFDKNYPKPLSQVLRYDDLLYVVFSDVDRATDVNRPYTTTIPRWIRLEHARYVEENGEMVMLDPNDSRWDTAMVDPYNYVSVDRDKAASKNSEYCLNGQEGLGQYGFCEFPDNRYVEMSEMNDGNAATKLSSLTVANDDYSYYILSRKVVNAYGGTLDLRHILAASYNWLSPSATMSLGSSNQERQDNARYHKYEVENPFQLAREDNAQIPNEGNLDEDQVNAVKQAMGDVHELSTQMRVDRTGYLNFFSDDYSDAVVGDTGKPAGNGLKYIYDVAAKYDVNRWAPVDYTVTCDGSIIANYQDVDHNAISLIDNAINDNYALATTKSYPFMYRVHVTLAGGQLPTLHDKVSTQSAKNAMSEGATQPDAPVKTVKFNGGVAQNTTFSLERMYSTDAATKTGIHELVVPSTEQAAQFTATVSVAPGHITVTGVQQAASLYDVAGHTYVANARNISVDVPAGVYIVVADGAARKVLVP